VLPAHGPAMCLKIIRREFGSLNQLAAELMDLARGRLIEKESLVLIFSGTHLARVGTVAYTEDLTAAVAAIKSVLGQEIKVAPLPPIFLGGCDSKVVIRSCAEMSVWADSVFSEEDGFMQNSFRLAAQMLEAVDEGEAQLDYNIRMRLPASTVPAGGKKTWEMGGFKLLTKLKPASVEQENKVVLSLIHEIRQKLAINIDPALAFNRKVPTEDEVGRPGGRKIYLAVGGSNAERLAEAMGRKGDLVDVVVIPGWRATNVGIKILEGRMLEAIARRKPDVLILECLDDNIYF
jgi:hypothetical protein